MMAPFGTGPIEHSAIRRVLVEDLALQNAAVLERQMKDVSVSRGGHGIKPHHRRRAADVLQAVANAPHVAVTTMQTPHSVERLSLRHLRHTCSAVMQRADLRRARRVGTSECGGV